MNITKQILDEAKARAEKHIKLVTDRGFDDQWESDPYDHWDHIDDFDLNFVGEPDDDGGKTTWSCAIYTGQYNSEGTWSTNYSDYVPFYVVGHPPLNFVGLKIERVKGTTYWSPVKHSIDDLIAHYKRYPVDASHELIVYWDDEGKLTRTCIEL